MYFVLSFLSVSLLLCSFMLGKWSNSDVILTKSDVLMMAPNFQLCSLPPYSRQCIFNYTCSKVFHLRYISRWSWSDVLREVD